MRKPARKTLRLRADKVFSEYIRKRDNYKCFTCGKVGSPADGVMQCGHLFSRVNFSTRWDEDNAFCQCRGCNMRHEYDFEVFRAAYVAARGQEAYDALHRKHREVKKFSDADLLEIIYEYETKFLTKYIPDIGS